jgi:hypothetical protein
MSDVALTNCVGRDPPFTNTTELPAKLVPVAVIVNGALPTVMLVGLMLVSTGAGGGAVTVNVAWFDTPPPGVGFVTVTAWFPTLAMSLAVMVVISVVALRKPAVRVVPSHCTVDGPAMKPVPVIVSVNPFDPAAIPAGPNALITGVGYVTVTFPDVDTICPVVPLNSRVLHASPGEVGAVNVSVALVTPVGGGDDVLFRYL